MLADIALMLIALFTVLLVITALLHVFFLLPYVPTSRRVVEKMIRAAALKPNERVFDLGCGDGRLVFAAEKKRARAVGFELAPLVFLLAHIKKLARGSRAHILFKNLFDANLRDANVIFCYLIPHVMPRLAAKIKRECKKGTRIISNTFHIPGLALEKVIEKNTAERTPSIYIYRV